MDMFLHRYEGIEPPSAVLLNILNGWQNANESLSVYDSRLVTSLLTKWKGMSQEEMAVSLVLAHTFQIDPRLHSSIFITNIRTKNELQQLSKAYAFSKVSDNFYEANGWEFYLFFDSDAECSLVKEKLCNKLAGKRIYNKEE